MKIAISDGHKNGHLGDLRMDAHVEGEGRPYAVAEIPDARWEEWHVFFRQLREWERYWTKLLLDKGNRYRSKP